MRIRRKDKINFIFIFRSCYRASTLRQYLSDEKNIQTSIANWNLHFLTKSFNRGFQEVVFILLLFRFASLAALY